MSKVKPLGFHDFCTVAKKVEFLLQQNESLRDSDMELFSAYYFHEIGKQQLDLLTAYDLLNKISNGELPSFETIGRERRNVQKRNEAVRGKYYKRKKPEVGFLFKVNQPEL